MTELRRCALWIGRKSRGRLGAARIGHFKAPRSQTGTSETRIVRAAMHLRPFGITAARVASG